MSVNNTVNKQVFNGDGSTEVWPVTDFKVFAQTEIRCIIKNPTAGTIAGLAPGASVELTYAVDFTVALTTAGALPPYAPTVTITNTTYDDLAVGLKLVVLRGLPLTQLINLRDNQGTPAATYEQVFDRAVMLVQQLQEILNRVPSFDFFSTASAPTIEDPETGKALIWNADGDLVNSDTDFDEVVEEAAASAAAAAASEASAASYAADASSSATLASQWATLTTGLVAATDNSAKSWAIGGTGAGDPSAGSAKKWATETSSTVNGAEYSAKEYAQGTQAAVGGSAKDWAQKTSAAVTGSSYSAKEWATGTQTRGAASGGSSKDWATYVSGTVDDTDYSAKEWAKGTQTRGIASGGSAKDWANYTGGTVDNAEYSAKKYAVDSAASAAAAAASAASAGFATSLVSVKTANYPLVSGDAGSTIVMNGSSLTATLPDIASSWVMIIKNIHSSALTIAKHASDTLEVTTLAQNQTVILVADTTNNAWRAVALFFTLPSGTIVGTSDTQTLTNKRITDRVQSVADAATITPNADNDDCVDITAIAQAFTIANPSGTPTNFQKLTIRIKDNGTARAITWGANYVAGGVSLPTTTVLSKILTLGFRYNTANSLNKWQLVASAQEA